MTLRARCSTRGAASRASKIVAAFLFGECFFLYHAIAGTSGRRCWTRFQPCRPCSGRFAGDQIGAFALMLCIVVADRRRGATRADAQLTRWQSSPARRWLLRSDARIVATSPEIAAKRIPASGCFGLPLDTFSEWLILAGAATFVYADRRRARAARARMHAAELERTNAAKRTLESRLQAMQARVEPQFLFNTLAQVHDLYRADAALGERMLDELIAYLRAAMPKMRDTSSTVGAGNRTRARLSRDRAASARRPVRLRDRRAGPRTADARMPPMMLLPLVDHAIAHGLAASQATESIRIRGRRRADGPARDRRQRRRLPPREQDDEASTAPRAVGRALRQ